MASGGLYPKSPADPYGKQIAFAEMLLGGPIAEAELSPAGQPLAARRKNMLEAAEIFNRIYNSQDIVNAMMEPVTQRVYVEKERKRLEKERLAEVLRKEREAREAADLEKLKLDIEARRLQDKERGREEFDRLETGYIQTIREKIIKVAGIFQETTRRIRLILPESYPYQSIWAHLILHSH